MAFSGVTERGSATEKVSDTSIAMSPSANLAVDKIVMVLVGTDNAATTSGASTNHDTLADTDGHTWNKVYERTRSSGAANDGVTHSLWWTKATVQIGTGDSITFTGDTNVTAKVIMAWEGTIGAGNTIQVASGGTAFLETSGTNPAALVLSGLPSKEYWFVGIMVAEEEFLTWTESATFTNIFASEGVSSGPAGTPTSNVTAFAAYRIATDTGATFDVGAVASSDQALALIAFEEVSGGTTFFITPTGSITPTGLLARQANKQLSGSATGSGTVARLVSKLLTGITTGVGSVSKLTSKLAAGAVTATGALTTAKIFLRDMAGSVAASGTLVRTTVKNLAGTITGTGTVARVTSKTVAGSTTPTGAVSFIKLILANMAGAITATGTLARNVAKTVTGSVTNVGSVTKTVSKAIAGNVTSSGALAKVASKVLAGAVTPSGILSLLQSGAASLFRRLEGVLTTGRQEGGHTAGRQEGTTGVDRQEGTFE